MQIWVIKSQFLGSFYLSDLLRPLRQRSYRFCLGFIIEFSFPFILRIFYICVFEPCKQVTGLFSIPKAANPTFTISINKKLRKFILQMTIIMILWDHFWNLILQRITVLVSIDINHLKIIFSNLIFEQSLHNFIPLVELKLVFFHACHMCKYHDLFLF